MEVEIRRVDNCVEIECLSCHVEFIVSEPDDALCRGCGLVVCQGCTDAFGHCDDPETGKRGKHGTGDPADRIAALEAENASITGQYDRLRAGHMSAVEAEVVRKRLGWRDYLTMCNEVRKLNKAHGRKNRRISSLRAQLREAEGDLRWLATRLDTHATHSVLHIFRSHPLGMKPTLHEVIAKARLTPRSPPEPAADEEEG